LIDVSQSVGDDHPLAIEFLKRDLRNLNHYYRQQGVETFRPRLPHHVWSNCRVRH
jgi:serine/threonine-protein kinase RIO1